MYENENLKNDKNYIPWVEKYRPTNFETIVLSDENKEIFNNIFNYQYSPNLLLYGPPGTGKTTTIMNLIHKYQQENNQLNKGLMIHLNASDERGIDIIRNQINNFVNSKNILAEGMKFIILDEVDYMTKNAQQALKYVLQEYQPNIRFYLICNYISKIEDCLQNELVKIRFNQLPKNEILKFLSTINVSENLKLTAEQLECLCINYKSDIRSMINFMQCNQFTTYNISIISKDVYSKIDRLIKGNNANFIVKFKSLIENYNIDIDTILKKYCNHKIKTNKENLNYKTLKNIEYILHNSNNTIDNKLNLLYYLFTESL
jgi:DNA polymerase III delta prime subunit